MNLLYVSYDPAVDRKVHFFYQVKYMPCQILGRLKLIACFASKYFQSPMREQHRPLEKALNENTKFWSKMSVHFFSLESLKLYEGVDAEHTINFKQPYTQMLHYLRKEWKKIIFILLKKAGALGQFL